jgi:DNA-binding winged helix-turn-helix (wHTH) protein/TolB-like protein
MRAWSIGPETTRCSRHWRTCRAALGSNDRSACDNGRVSDLESGRFRFGLYEFDRAARELRRDGVLVRLQSQPAQVLACLIERADQVVSREDLRKAVWGDSTFVDFERGLNFCVSQIRVALKDDSKEPTYVRTVPKSGYQFIAPVQRISAGRLGPPEIESPPRRPFAARTSALAFAFAALALLSFIAYRYRSATNQTPILAVLRFDNETGDPGITRFSDALTDNLVEQLTAQSKSGYRIIGNAKILRLPRDQRDLTAVASSLHAGYVVLGQVQSNGTQVRILAHLIRMPDQTHIWVARMDRALDDPLSLESEAACKIAAEFSPRILEDPSRAASFPSAIQ